MDSANWWSVAGLVLGIVGVVGVGFGPSRIWGIGLYSTPDELPDRGSLLGLSWSAMVIGFGLQLIAQFRG